MLFNSIDFLIFFPIALIVFYIVPERFRYIWLLIASYYFYMQWNPAYALLLFGATFVTYVGALILEKTSSVRVRKMTLVTAIVIDLGFLCYFKYSMMFMGYINKILSVTAHRQIPWDMNIVLPVGISFFTFQALGYLIDVYRGDTYAEHNFLRYALFISFFPQLVAGPIERSRNLLKQLAKPQKFSFENLKKGLFVMLYGFFMKVVIADRLAILVDTVFADPVTWPGMYILVASTAFTIQIYCDFYGYSTIARGTALTMGIELMDNFNAPYFARTISELWRRWHLSLSTWFRDYLYIPLGGNRKGTFRKYLNIMIVFAVSGLWHGASLSFVIWGALQGAFQLIEAGVGYVRDKLGIRRGDGIISRVLGAIVTFILFDISFIIFRSNSLTNLRVIIDRLFGDFDAGVLFDGSILDLGVSAGYMWVLLIALIIFYAVDVIKYKTGDVRGWFFARPLWFKCVSVVFLLTYIIVFGRYGGTYDVKQFIYFQF